MFPERETWQIRGNNESFLTLPWSLGWSELNGLADNTCCRICLGFIHSVYEQSSLEKSTIVQAWLVSSVVGQKRCYEGSEGQKQIQHLFSLEVVSMKGEEIWKCLNWVCFFIFMESSLNFKGPVLSNFPGQMQPCQWHMRYILFWREMTEAFTKLGNIYSLT